MRHRWPDRRGEGIAKRLDDNLDFTGQPMLFLSKKAEK